MKKKGNKTVGVRLRVVLEPDIAFGPGKAALLEGIRETGSIAAAGRRMGMSYKRAWSLVEEMNTDFGTPVAATSKGGRNFGGATLTDGGERLLALYQAMETSAAAATKKDFEALRRLLQKARV